LVATIRDVLRSPAALIVLMLALGVVLHEVGHAFAAILCGGSITDITLFSVRPTVSACGNFTRNQELVIALAGSGSVLLAWFLVRRASVRPGVVLDAASLLAMVELIGWAVSALSYPNCPAGNDAARVIVAAQIKPGLVAGTSLLLAGCGLLFHNFFRLPRAPHSEPRDVHQIAEP
jgi:hypothetical protein